MQLHEDYSKDAFPSIQKFEPLGSQCSFILQLRGAKLHTLQTPIFFESKLRNLYQEVRTETKLTECSVK
jgi:hypothetical protein